MRVHLGLERQVIGALLIRPDSTVWAMDSLSFKNMVWKEPVDLVDFRNVVGLGQGNRQMIKGYLMKRLIQLCQGLRQPYGQFLHQDQRHKGNGQKGEKYGQKDIVGK